MWSSLHVYLKINNMKQHELEHSQRQSVSLIAIPVQLNKSYKLYYQSSWKYITCECFLKINGMDQHFYKLSYTIRT
jgi:hypothetical protein